MVRALGLIVLVACGGMPEADAGRTLPDSGAIDASIDAGRGLDAGDPGTPGPRFVGRHSIESDGSVRFSWPGSGFIVRFRGTEVRATMSDAGGFFTVVVDGAVLPTLAIGDGEQLVTIAGGLPDGEHTVEVYRRTEGGLFGPTVVRSIEVDGTLLAVPEPTRSIEIIGDSISAGYGVDGADEFCNFSADTENHFLTYGAVAARTLDAELSTVAWSGKGVIFNYDTDTFEPMPELYDRTIAGEDGSTGVIRDVDAVVINLGTNDFSTGGDPTAEMFTNAYVALLEAVRAQHPNALVFCTIAPALGGDDGTRATSYIDAAVNARVTAGDARVLLIEIGTGVIDDWGCDYHPGDRTHAVIADRLVTVLSGQLDW